ncbi:DUF7288 family protein [Natrinema salinisoli]|uniref:DUF7288 family protein n=1 Tax=Natrinema salinisoli TaxID=2878535 RepID=UPI001CF07A0B|nr:hypothetical protein [Natrinema salinisoli]
MSDDINHTERGQAYTLEGFIGAMVVLLAVLFALQSVVITPTTGGLADRTVQEQVQQEARDMMVVSNQDGNLSNTTRYWDGTGGFNNTDQPPAPGETNRTYSVDRFANESDLGRLLKDRFSETGWSYNVELHTETSNRTIVYQGNPPASALTASYTVTTYNDQNITWDGDDRTLEEAAADGDESIPQRNPGDETAIYNVVEVRVILW